MSHILGRSGLVLAGCLFVASLAGCQTAARERGLPPHFESRNMMGSLPLDLPEHPDPCVQYCKEWVPPTYRMVPTLVQKDCGDTQCVTETVFETTACEVLVKPRTGRKFEKCGTSCEEELVQVKPGGFRWVRGGDDCKECWQYCDAPPEYKWCSRKVEEDGIRYCVEDPPEYKTVVKTVPVQRTRTEYRPPRFEIEYVRELYQPGHHEWVPRCQKGCIEDPRKFAPAMSGGALDCGCPSTN